MGTVNPSTPATLPPSNSIVSGFESIGKSLGSTMKDAGHYTGVLRVEDEGPRPDFVAVGGLIGVNAGISGAMALANRTNPLTGVTQTMGETFSSGARTMATNTIRVTPTLVSAIAGPAVADGITMIAPNLVPKYRDTKTITNSEEKKAAEATNKNAKMARAIAAAAVVGIGAGIAFLVKPDLFKRFGANFVPDEAIKGATQYVTSTGGRGVVPGVLTPDQLTGVLTASKKLIGGETVEILKTISPMARDAAFSNRMLLAGAGGVGTLLLANKAAGEEGAERMKWGVAAAAAGALTVGGVYGIGKLTERSMLANSGAGGLLSKNEMFFKPNMEWIKAYAGKIAPITAVPAGTAASQYFNIVDDFGEITGSRSPFRK